MKIGVLDIQGSVEEHFLALKKAGAEPFLVKTPEALAAVSGLIIPGGESTTIGMLLTRFGLRNLIIKRAKAGMPVWGTCAGAILLAKKIEGRQGAESLGLMNITIERNAYGAQLESFETEFNFNFGEKEKKISGVFIRAPKILKAGKGVEILAEYQKKIVAVKEGNLLATTFHPELTSDLAVHRFFVTLCKPLKR